MVDFCVESAAVPILLPVLFVVRVPVLAPDFVVADFVDVRFDFVVVFVLFVVVAIFFTLWLLAAEKS